MPPGTALICALCFHFVLVMPTRLALADDTDEANLATLRQKRDDDCHSCTRAPARTDPAYRKYHRFPECRFNAMMVCKHCQAVNLRNVTLHAIEREFEVWCFSSGIIHNMGDGVRIGSSLYTFIVLR